MEALSPARRHCRMSREDGSGHCWQAACIRRRRETMAMPNKIKMATERVKYTTGFCVFLIFRSTLIDALRSFGPRARLLPVDLLRRFGRPDVLRQRRNCFTAKGIALGQRRNQIDS